MRNEPWAPVAGSFVTHYESLYGQARTLVLHHHLREHLPPPPARIVDVGGGAGHQTIPLARDGYEVTILDPSPEMLAAAESRLTHETRSVRERVSLVEGPGESAPDVLGNARFQGVLCHGVLMYLDDPEPMVTALAELTAPSGIVSIVAKNRRALAMRPATEKDWEATLEAFDADRQVNGLGLETRGDTVAGLAALLTARRIQPTRWYGVRLFTEGWGRTQRPADPRDPVIAAELEASRRDPYRRLSRLFHLVGTRS